MQSEESEPTETHSPITLHLTASDQMSFALESEKKVCRGCHRALPIEVFARVTVKGAEYRMSDCNTCRGIRLSSSPNQLRKRKAINDAKSRPCIDCGRSFDIVCMDLDHVRGEKTFALSTSWRWKSFAAIQDELAKCEPVCACCHRLRMKNRPAGPRGYSQGRRPAFLASGARTQYAEPLEGTCSPPV
jgi:hypothetical protein